MPVDPGLGLEWSTDLGGDPVLIADGMNVEHTFWTTWEVRLGWLGLGWSQGPDEPDSEGHLEIAPLIPAEAFLHELAADYLTVLVVRVEEEQEGHVVARDRAPVAFLAFPDGPGAPLLWDKATAMIEAPLGVVNDALRDALDLAPDVDWVLPQVPRTEPPAPDPDETRLREDD